MTRRPPPSRVPIDRRAASTTATQTRSRAACSTPSMLLQVTARRAAQARPAHAVAQPGDVHRRDRRRLEHRAGDAHESAVVRLADRGLALADRAVRQPRRGGGRGPRQGPGRNAAQGQDRHHGPAAHGTGRPASPAPRRRSRAPLLQQGDIVVVEAGQVIPGDGDVVEGIASVDESAITGESAPVIRESGGDRSAVTGGTTVLSRPHRRARSPRSPARASSTG